VHLLPATLREYFDAWCANVPDQSAVAQRASVVSIADVNALQAFFKVSPVWPAR
jgi:hypothetical protein